MFMKKILFIVSVLLAGGLAGCSENEIELYNQEVCLNFANPGWSTEFTDADYVNGVTTKEAPVTVADCTAYVLPEKPGSGRLQGNGDGRLCQSVYV